MVDIKGLDKKKVLQALYGAARPQGMGFARFAPGPLTETELEHYTNPLGRFDYLKGRVMKVDISNDSFDEFLFDRDNGEGAAQRAISSIGAAS